jgi:hypothetical protein
MMTDIHEIDKLIAGHLEEITRLKKCRKSAEEKKNIIDREIVIEMASLEQTRIGKIINKHIKNNPKRLYIPFECDDDSDEDESDDDSDDDSDEGDSDEGDSDERFIKWVDTHEIYIDMIYQISKYSCDERKKYNKKYIEKAIISAHRKFYHLTLLHDFKCPNCNDKNDDTSFCLQDYKPMLVDGNVVIPRDIDQLSIYPRRSNYYKEIHYDRINKDPSNKGCLMKISVFDISPLGFGCC